MRIDLSDHGDLSTAHIVAALWDVKLVNIKDNDHATVIPHHHPEILWCHRKLLRVRLKHACRVRGLRIVGLLQIGLGQVMTRCSPQLRLLLPIRTVRRLLLYECPLALEL